ncbi:Putative D-mannonate oxidoreductase [Klebsiella aerogenes]|nr:Putative D-mannonate oxidoreductase [Klebsiella aerogenes]
MPDVRSGRKPGAELVADVVPFEEMKLRMLNGSHSFLAYLGYLAGYQHINDCMQDDNYRRAALSLMLDEQAPTLKVQGVDLSRYASLLIGPLLQSGAEAPHLADSHGRQPEVAPAHAGLNTLASGASA